MTRDVLDLGSWCILQMNSADTLRVVEALMAEGLGVWTPVDWSIGRKPVTRARYDKPTPMMPGYAFGDAGHIDALVRLVAMRRRDIPRFWFLEDETQAGHAPLVSDRALDAVRSEEERRRAAFELAKRKDFRPPKPEMDTEVRLPDGPFGGLNGEVRRTKGRDIVVDIPNMPFTLKVSSLLLLESVAKVAVPDTGTAARAA